MQKKTNVEAENIQVNSVLVPKTNWRGSLYYSPPLHDQH